MKGMTTHYIYEEFIPNHEMDIRRRCADFFKHYLDKANVEYFDYDLTEAYKKDTKLRNFRDAFDSFKNKRFKITNLTIDGELAWVEYKGSFTAYVGGEGLKFKGKGNIELEGSYGCWLVTKVEWPGRVE
jgi:glutaredoxin-related protein